MLRILIVAGIRAGGSTGTVRPVYIVLLVPYIGCSWAGMAVDGDLRGRVHPMARERQFLGVTATRWFEYLVAILIGNAIYYLSLAPHLPDAFRHQGFGIDGGVVLDFVVCVAVYGLIRLGVRLNGGFLERLRTRQ